MRNQQATCGWCGEPIERNAGRMRLHETDDSSVRHTRMVLSFHPHCGRMVVETCELRREQAEARAATRRVWARGPLANRVPA